MQETDGLIFTVVGIICIAECLALWAMIKLKQKEDKETKEREEMWK